jgi:benzoyl-CoA reductase/2-hydroxyglutaryl-CoA dehydratase subunit BcrC/BadD/HgdB
MAELSWLGALGTAHDAPHESAERWRAEGGKVIGLFGRYAPRELVSGAGMLAIPLDPARHAGGHEGSDHTPQGLGGELSGAALGLVSALLAGELEWIDGLVIGRDSEAHTKLFYVLREMAADAEFRRRVPPLAFSDMLRLPLRTSSVYNRLRLRELAEVIATWGGGAVSRAALCGAIAEEALIAGQLRELGRLRASTRITAADHLIATVGARTLPAPQASAALSQAIAVAERNPARAPGPAVFVTGSEPGADIYAVLESAGMAIVGDDWDEDHLDLGEPGERGDLAGLAEQAIGDPLDWLADHYQFGTAGAARAGLDRVRQTAERVQALGADGVLQVILPGDEASGWELAELRMLLPETLVSSVEIVASEPWDKQLRDAADALISGLASGGRGGEVVNV